MSNLGARHIDQLPYHQRHEVTVGTNPLLFVIVVVVVVIIAFQLLCQIDKEPLAGRGKGG